MSSLNTTERLLDDNDSPQAKVKIERWREGRDTGRLFVLGACSDSRLILPEMAYHIRTISATGPRSPWHEALNYDKVKGVLILDHFDCGGLATKAAISGREVTEGGALAYVRDHVWHTDPVYQSILTASWTASRTHKPVLAAVQDHHDGAIYIQGAFKNEDQTEHKTIPTYLLMSKYIDEDIYRNGRPVLKESLVPPLFIPCRKEITEKAESLLLVNANFRESQAVQDMEFVVLSDNLKPLSVRFPGMFGEPNRAFQVSLRRQSPDEADLNNKDVQYAFRQIHYPIAHCIENQGKPRSAFQSTRVLYIETGKMEVSERLAKQALRRRWIQEWLELPNREIIVAEVIAGRIQRIDRVDQAA